MSYFLGSAGNVRLRRSSEAVYSSLVHASDINTVLNRFSFDGSLENILTGDRLDISTADPRGLEFFAPATWSSGQVEKSITNSFLMLVINGARRGHRDSKTH
jgi:hypothetical protein